MMTYSAGMIYQNPVAVFGPGVIGPYDPVNHYTNTGVKTKLFGWWSSWPSNRPRDIGLRRQSLQWGVLRCRRKNQHEAYYDYQVRRASNQFINKEDELEINVVEYVLAATGRRPNTDKLGLENTSLELDERGVPIADHYTCKHRYHHSIYCRWRK